MVACGSVGETKDEGGAEGGGLVEEVLREEEDDTRGGALVCGLGEGGMEFRSGGIVRGFVGKFGSSCCASQWLRIRFSLK
jgi:hypothetical protein